MFEYVTSFNQLGNFVSDIQKTNEIFFDTETTGLDFFTDKIVLIQCKLNNKTYIFDTRKLGDRDSNYIIQIIKDSNVLVTGFNLKFDMKMVKTNYGELFTNVYDLMIGETLITNGLTFGKDRYISLSDLTTKYCGIALDKEIRASFITDNPIITEQMLIYSAEDVEYLGIIKQAQILKLAEQKQTKVSDLEMKLLPVICSMELEGVLVDQKVWERLGGEAFEQVEKIRKELIDEIFDEILKNFSFDNALQFCDFLSIKEGAKAKRDRTALELITELSFVTEKVKELVNLNSSAQLLAILQRVYKIDIPDTNEKTINKFELEHPIISKILNYREFAKTVSTYGDSYLSRINPETGRIHTEFNQLGMVSGRISSSKPNLQNIKRESAFRNAFVARPNKKILSIDYSQEELRLLAVVAKVKGMIEAYRKKIDLHTKTACGLFKLVLEEFLVRLNAEEKEAKMQRYKGKTMNFAVGYGSSEYGLWKNFGIPMKEGKQYLKTFYEELYPEIEQTKKVVGEKIFSLGYSTTLTGRKRFFEMQTFFPGGAKERDRFLASTLREGFNHMIQGTGADIIKMALTRIFYENPFGDGLKILIQVYDELVVELDEEIAEEGKDFVTRIMLECEQQFLGDVLPAEVDGKLGDYWKH